MASSAPQGAQRVAAVRRFNRFYTQHLGMLQDGWLDSPFSLTQARVLYEIRQRDRATASDIGRDLGLDAGYLSRLLRSFEKQRLIERRPSLDDARQKLAYDLYYVKNRTLFLDFLILIQTVRVILFHEGAR